MQVLPIKKKWFDMILTGEKEEEYREIKPYYDKRLGYLARGTGKVTTIILRNGYSYNSPSIKCKVAVSIGPGIKEWGAVPGENCYILRILKILEIKNINIIRDIQHLKKYIPGRENCTIYITDYCRYEITKLSYEESYDLAENIRLRNINIIALEVKR